MTTTPVAPATTNIFQNIEAAIEAFIQKAVSDVEVVIADIEHALSNVAAVLPNATAAIQSAESFVSGLPIIGQNPTVQASIAAMNVGMGVLNGFAQTWTQATTGGGITATAATQAINQAYVGYHQVLAAVSTVKAVATQAATQPAAAQPVVTASPTPSAS